MKMKKLCVSSLLLCLLSAAGYPLYLQKASLLVWVEILL